MSKEFQVIQDNKDHKVLTSLCAEIEARKVTQDDQAMMDLLDSKENQDNPESQDHQGQKEILLVAR